MSMLKHFSFFPNIYIYIYIYIYIIFPGFFHKGKLRIVWNGFIGNIILYNVSFKAIQSVDKSLMKKSAIKLLVVENSHVKSKE